MRRSGTDPLLLGLAAGREQAFAALYDWFATRLFRTALAMLGRREDAEDAVQEVFVSLVRSREKLTEVHDLTAYLFTALRRAAARCASRRAKEPAVSETAAEEAVAPAAQPELDTPYSERLEQVLGSLPTRQREAIVLKVDAELTFAQIARVTGVSINTAASRYRYALEKIRAGLEE